MTTAVPCGGELQKGMAAAAAEVGFSFTTWENPLNVNMWQQGVDFGARQQIFAALDKATREGTAIICASTDNEQLAQICDRVIVFARNRPVLELSGAALTKENISEACYNSAGHAGAAKESA